MDSPLHSLPNQHSRIYVPVYPAKSAEIVVLNSRCDCQIHDFYELYFYFRGVLLILQKAGADSSGREMYC